MKTGEAHKKWEEVFKEIEEKKSELDGILGASRQLQEQINSISADLTAKSNDLTINTAEVKQKFENISQILGEIDQHKSTISQKADLASQEIDSIQEVKTSINVISKQLKDLSEKNNKQSEQVSDLLKKAVAVSLFHSFDARKKQLGNYALFWGASLGISLAVLAIAAVGLVTFTNILKDPIHYIIAKFLLSLPLIYWIGFSTKEYSKAQRLNEEYSFKSALSLSLEAYRDLIKRESLEATKTDVVPFITQVVDKIFTSPSVTISKHPLKEEKDFLDSFIDRLTNFVNAIKK